MCPVNPALDGGVEGTSPFVLSLLKHGIELSNSPLRLTLFDRFSGRAGEERRMETCTG